MFPQDPAVEAAGVDAQFFGDQEPKARRVQVGAAADDAVLREAAELPGDIGQHVNCWRARGRERASAAGVRGGEQGGGVTAPGLETTMMTHSGLYRTI